MNAKILCVDDDVNILTGFERTLRKDFDVKTAVGGEAGLKALAENGPFSVIVADMQMPGMDGLQFLMEAERLAPDSVRLMLTGNADQKTAVDAVNQGHVFRFLSKPCPPEALGTALRAGVKQYRLVTAEKELLGKTLTGAIDALTGILSMMDPTSFGMGEKMRDYMRVYLRGNHLPDGWALEMAALLSQVGYVAIPAHVLRNARAGLPLRPAERDMLALVPRTGAEMLSKIPRLEIVAEIILYQAKQFGGAGFPSDSVSGDAIPHGARILKVLRDLVELEAEGLSRPEAFSRLKSRVGWYDPAILDQVVGCLGREVPPSQGVQEAVETQVTDLVSGDVFVRNVVTTDGTMIICDAGTVVSPLLIEKLRNFDQLVGLRRPLLVQNRAFTQKKA